MIFLNRRIISIIKINTVRSANFCKGAYIVQEREREREISWESRSLTVQIFSSSLFKAFLKSATVWMPLFLSHLARSPFPEIPFKRCTSSFSFGQLLFLFAGQKGNKKDKCQQNIQIQFI